MPAEEPQGSRLELSWWNEGSSSLSCRQLRRSCQQVLFRPTRGKEGVHKGLINMTTTFRDTLNKACQRIELTVKAGFAIAVSMSCESSKPVILPTIPAPGFDVVTTVYLR